MAWRGDNREADAMKICNSTSIWRQQMPQNLVVQATVDELFGRELAVVILVELVHDLLYAFRWRVFSFSILFAQQIIYGLDYLLHLFAVDLAIFILLEDANMPEVKWSTRLNV